MGGTKIPQLVEGQTYYVYRRDANTIELADTYSQAVDRTITQISAGSGASHTFTTKAKIKSITSINESSENQVWLLVERRINGTIKKYVEYLDPTLNMDCTLSAIVNAGTTIVTG